MADSLIEVEVVYAAVASQRLLSLKVASGTTVRDVVRSSSIASEFPELDPDNCPIGIFGKVIADPAVRVVEPGDRIEIYRPLLADPKEIRRLRAAKAAEARAREE